MASANQMSGLADQYGLPEGLDMDQPLFNDYDNIENLPPLDQNYSQSMFPILRKDIDDTMPSTVARVNVDEESTVPGNLDVVPDISPTYETGVDATITNQTQEVPVINTHSTQSVGPATNNSTTSSL